MDKETKIDFAVAWIIIMLVVMCIGLVSCRSIKYVPVETIKTEYVVKDSIRVDSTYVHDSIFIREKNDTVYLYKYKYIDRYKYINLTDTILKTDTISKVVEVEKKLTKWQSIKMDFGGGAMLALLLAVLVLALYIVFKNFIRK